MESLCFPVMYCGARVEQVLCILPRSVRMKVFSAAWTWILEAPGTRSSIHEVPGPYARGVDRLQRVNNMRCAGCDIEISEGAVIEGMEGEFCDECFAEELDTLNSQIGDDFEQGRCGYPEEVGE